jgi:hypothetical protein
LLLLPYYGIILPSLSNLPAYYFSNPFAYSYFMNYDAYIILPLPFPWLIIPTCYDILDAVILLSPVTIITFIPAILQFSIAYFDCYLGGSSMPKMPNKINPLFSISSNTSLFLLYLVVSAAICCAFTGLYATLTVLYPFLAIPYSYYINLFFI